MIATAAQRLHESAGRYGNATAEPSVALHVGGADEIGRATILRLARSGMTVVGCDRDQEWLSEVEEALAADGHPGLMLDIGAASQRDVGQVVEKALSAFGRIDVLVVSMSCIDWPSAGTGDGGQSALRWMKAVSPHISAAGGGHIVNVVSSLGRYRSSYCLYDADQESSIEGSAAEGAIVALTRQAAFELSRQKIRVNAVAVGWIRGERTEKEWRRLSERDRTYLLEEISLRRLGEPEEVAAAIQFLATPASSYVTGTVLDVNGGWWMS